MPDAPPVLVCGLCLRVQLLGLSAGRVALRSGPRTHGAIFGARPICRERAGPDGSAGLREPLVGENRRPEVVGFSCCRARRSRTRHSRMVAAIGRCGGRSEGGRMVRKTRPDSLAGPPGNRTVRCSRRDVPTGAGRRVVVVR